MLKQMSAALCGILLVQSGALAKRHTLQDEEAGPVVTEMGSPAISPSEPPLSGSPVDQIRVDLESAGVRPGRNYIEIRADILRLGWRSTGQGFGFGLPSLPNQYPDFDEVTACRGTALAVCTALLSNGRGQTAEIRVDSTTHQIIEVSVSEDVLYAALSALRAHPDGVRLSMGLINASGKNLAEARSNILRSGWLPLTSSENNPRGAADLDGIYQRLPDQESDWYYPEVWSCLFYRFNHCTYIYTDGLNTFLYLSATTAGERIDPVYTEVDFTVVARD